MSAGQARVHARRRAQRVKDLHAPAVLVSNRARYMRMTSALKSPNRAFLVAFLLIEAGHRIERHFAAIRSEGSPQAGPDQPGGAAGGDPRQSLRAEA